MVAPYRYFASNPTVHFDSAPASTTPLASTIALAFTIPLASSTGRASYSIAAAAPGDQLDYSADRSYNLAVFLLELERTGQNRILACGCHGSVSDFEDDRDWAGQRSIKGSRSAGCIRYDCCGYYQASGLTLDAGCML